MPTDTLKRPKSDNLSHLKASHPVFHHRPKTRLKTSDPNRNAETKKKAHLKTVRVEFMANRKFTGARKNSIKTHIVLL